MNSSINTAIVDKPDVVGFKFGGTQAAVLREGDTPKLITFGRAVMTDLAKAAERKGQTEFPITPVMSLAGNVVGNNLELTESMARNLREANITKVGNKNVIAGESISLEDLFNDSLRSKKLPTVKFINPIVGNDGDMVMRAAAANNIVPYGEAAGLLICSTGANVLITGKHNLEAGHASAIDVTRAATRKDYPDLFTYLDGVVRSNSKDSNPAYFIKGQATRTENSLEPILSGGEKGSAMKISDLNDYSTVKFRGVQVDANAAIAALDTAQARTIFEGLGITENDIKRSRLLTLANGNGIRNEDVTEQAANGDNFALALTKYAATRMAHAMIGTARLSGTQPPKNVILQGSYIKHVLAQPEALKAFKDTYKELTGRTPNTAFFNPNYDGVTDIMQTLAAKK